MAIRRIFFDWNEPCLPQVAAYLLKNYLDAPLADLSSLIVVTPGARAGRRLLELLVDRCDERGLRLSPPRFMTVGPLADMLAPPPRRPAQRLEKLMAWITALRGSAGQAFQPFLLNPPSSEEPLKWLSLAEVFDRLQTDLSADSFDFARVASQGNKLAAFTTTEAGRWHALAQLQIAYRDILTAADLCDPQLCRLETLFTDSPAEIEAAEILLVGTADLNPVVRRLLARQGRPITALVHAPAELADRFDEFGCVDVEQWRTAPISIQSEQVITAAGPADQAVAVVNAIASFAGKYSAESIVIGVPDRQLTPLVLQQLDQAGAPGRYGEGTPATRTGPAMLLRGIADYLEDGAYRDFASLARHPDLEAWLWERVPPMDDDRRPGLTDIDEYYSQYFPSRLTEVWRGDESLRNRVRRLHETTAELLAPLTGEPQPLGRWSAAILNVLAEIYGGVSRSRSEPHDALIIDACELLQDILRRHAEMAAALEPAVSAAEAIRLLLREAEDAHAPPAAGDVAVELLGWLELPLDDAPALIVTSMNEGYVPSSVNHDLFLPNGLRSRLGLTDNDRRYARDAYAISALLHAREQVVMIVGRRNVDGDPLAPSRMFFACEPVQQAQRVLQFFKPGDAETIESPYRLRAAGASRFLVPEPFPNYTPLTHLSVTGFRAYLACPYRFYLSRVLKLRSVGDAGQELDGGGFGTLCHETLARFGQCEEAASTDADRIRKYLHSELDKVAAELFGDAPLAAIRIQVEQLRLRLSAFATWQADWASAGWRIAHAEIGIDKNQAPLLVDDRPFYLTGRVDRIDIHRDTGQVHVFDYKTSEAGLPPDKTHRDKHGWIDLQLPLYRHLIKPLDLSENVQLGYILLPKDVRKVAHAMATWTTDDLADADATAFEMVRKIRAGVFGPMTQPAPPFSEEFAAICQDNLYGAPLDDAAEEYTT